MGSSLVGVVGHTIYKASAALGNNNAGFHNSLYRGKYLGNALTAEQSAAIIAGTFDGLFIGDYWTINGVNWLIADFDTYDNDGDTALGTHHIAVIPDRNLYSAKWNETNTTAGGYVASAIRANIKAASGDAQGAEAKVIAAFGNAHVLAYRGLLPSTYDASGHATGWAWVDCKVELMSEVEVYGFPAWSMGGLGYEVGHAKRQLSIFRHNHDVEDIRAYYWLRSVHSATNACIVSNNGNASNLGASNSNGVRPLSLIA